MAVSAARKVYVWYVMLPNSLFTYFCWLAFLQIVQLNLLCQILGPVSASQEISVGVPR